MKISIILLLIYFLLACGGSSTNNKMTAENKSPAPPAKTEQKTIPEKKPAPRPAAEKFPVISEVKFKSPARSRTDLELEASLAEPDFDVAFDFRWFVNDKEVIGVKEPVLPAHHFKSGDWVHCRPKIPPGQIQVYPHPGLSPGTGAGTHPGIQCARHLPVSDKGD
jgi:hypothetical protein